MSNLREPHKQEDIRKSNEYYMQMNEQKADFEPVPKGNSPFGILAILLLIISIPLTIFITPIAGLGLNIVAIIFSIIHRIIKKYGIICLIISILITIITGGVTIIGTIQPKLIPIPVFQEKETKPNKETSETKNTENKNNLTNTGWRIKEDDSCFYFLEDESFYWCKEENNFDDNYYYGTYKMLSGNKALDKLNELEVELDEDSQKNIKEVFYINMENEICYKNGEDISEEYNSEKPNREYFLIFTKNNENAIGFDVETYKELGFVNLTKTSDDNMQKIINDLKLNKSDKESTKNTEDTNNSDESMTESSDKPNSSETNETTNENEIESKNNTTEDDLSFLDQYTTKSNNETIE